MKSEAIYPGSFDPVTLGHQDLIERAAGVFDRVVIGVNAGTTSKKTLFSLEERMDLVRQVSQRFGNVEIDSFDGLLVDYARQKKIGILVRGLRAFSDFEYEFQMALANRKMAPDIETLFLMPKEDYSYVSSSIVREVAQLNGDIDEFVDPRVATALRARFQA